MTRRSNLLPETASQTAGPYVHIGLMPDVAGISGAPVMLGGAIAEPDVPGSRIRIEGRIFDGDGELVRDALIEILQVDADGQRAGAGAAPGFNGWGRVATDFDDGVWRVETIKPGSIGAEAPHLALWIVARGINTGLHTRMYFDDEANTTCPVLSAVPDARRYTLIAKGKDGVFWFDIHLQGPGETVFFDL